MCRGQSGDTLAHYEKSARDDFEQVSDNPTQPVWRLIALPRDPHSIIVGPADPAKTRFGVSAR